VARLRILSTPKRIAVVFAAVFYIVAGSLHFIKPAPYLGQQHTWLLHIGEEWSATSFLLTWLVFVMRKRIEIEVAAYYPR
jgi:hypothetical protein